MLIIGFVAGLNAATSLDSFLGDTQADVQLRESLFAAAAKPILLGCVPMLIIGAVGLYAGRGPNV